MKAEISIPHLVPEWPAPPGVRAISTLRGSQENDDPYATFNLGAHVGDTPERVETNRERLKKSLRLSKPPAWLDQVHGTLCIEAIPGAPKAADASFTRATGTACVVMTADCLPVLFAEREGNGIAAAHAGWKGLAGGVLESTLEALGNREVMAWLGPAIGPTAFEVGSEVREAFLDRHPDAGLAFSKTSKDRYHADLYQLARLLLEQAGVPSTFIFGGGRCTFSESTDFFSYRRDRTTGRMATLIWREEHPTP